MTETQWALFYVVALGAVGRVVKLVPSLPKSALPWIVLGAGYLITFGMAVYGGAALSDATISSWTGLAAGMAAIGGHEALKPLLGLVVDENTTAKILGKLPKKVSK